MKWVAGIGTKRKNVFYLFNRIHCETIYCSSRTIYTLFHSLNTQVFKYLSVMLLLHLLTNCQLASFQIDEVFTLAVISMSFRNVIGLSFRHFD